MRPRLLAVLILCNAIWAGNPVAGKILLEHFQPLQVSWLRAFSSLLTVALMAVAFRLLKPEHLSPFSVLVKPRNLFWLAALGLITFFGSMAIQFLGLAGSTATSYVVIVATEPLIALIMAFLFLRERVRPVQLAAFFIAMGGFCLLSDLRPDDLVASLSLFNTANLWILLSMVSDSMCSVISRILGQAVKPVSIFLAALPIGVIALTAFLFAKGVPLPTPSELTLRDWLAVLFFGPLGTALTYPIWALALGQASVATVSLTLFTQPILGTLAGYFFLGDRLSLWQCIGTALIAAALCLQTKVAVEESQDG